MHISIGSSSHGAANRIELICTMEEGGTACQRGQSFLKSGRGIQRRQQASQSSKRYIPKGGFLIDFTTQPLPKGKLRGASPGRALPVTRQVAIARQQLAAARLATPKQSATSSPVSKKHQLADLEMPEHPKPWGANDPKKNSRQTDDGQVLQRSPISCKGQVTQIQDAIFDMPAASMDSPLVTSAL